MNRNDKLQLLQSIKDKQSSKSSFTPSKTYVFFEHNGEVNQYIKEGKKFSLNEYEMFCKQVETGNKIKKDLGFRNVGSMVITIRYVRNQTIL